MLRSEYRVQGLGHYPRRKRIPQPYTLKPKKVLGKAVQVSLTSNVEEEPSSIKETCGIVSVRACRVEGLGLVIRVWVVRWTDDSCAEIPVPRGPKP